VGVSLRFRWHGPDSDEKLQHERLGDASRLVDEVDAALELKSYLETELGVQVMA
jgi:hypothetical protein